MGHYRSNLRDIEFALFECLGRGAVFGAEPFPEIDEGTARAILVEVERLATHELAESFAAADRNPPMFDPATSTVVLPESFKRSCRAYQETGWAAFGLLPELGGTATPPSLRWAVAELVLGANPAAHIYSSPVGFVNVLWACGTEEQKRWAKVWADKGWAGTMVLTEPDAGSDVGAARMRAVPQPDGSWHLEGVKRFITSGDHDVTDNIVHLVLARPVGVPGAGGPGTKGLSLFVVPKFHVDWATGELGERNGVYVTNVEHKMGLKVSATCELTFGEHQPAVGWLVGGTHDGITQMFKVIETARMLVGTKAIATLSTGYLNALDYAKSRVQGPDMTRMNDKTAPRVTITHHPDVRRSLLTQKAYAEGMRALVFYAATIQDDIATLAAAGDDITEPALLNDLLLPIVKGYGSEKSYAVLGAETLQTYGGSGYLQDYPIEQYVRDSKIDTLYEGTTAIQGLDLFFRKIVRDQGQTLNRLLTEVREFAKGDTGNGGLARERDLLGRAVEDVQGIVAAMVSALGESADDPASIYRVGQNTTRLLLAAGDLIVAWLLLRQADVALGQLAKALSESDSLFYRGKVAAAVFFACTVLPLLAGQRAVAESVDNALMELPEAAL